MVEHKIKVLKFMPSEKKRWKVIYPQLYRIIDSPQQPALAETDAHLFYLVL